MKRNVAGMIQWVCAIALAISFFLPLARHTSLVDTEGHPVGMMESFDRASPPSEVTTYSYFWEDMYWVVPLIFALPLLLTAIRGTRRGPIFAAVLDVATPMFAVGLLLLLNAMVTAASMFLSRTAVGGYVALVSLGCFTVVSGVRAAAAARRGFGEPAGTTDGNGARIN